MQELEPTNLPALLHAAGTQTATSTQFSRIHCLRLAALCATPGACPPVTWRALQQPPLLGKLLGLLSRSLRDADAAVRAAAAEGLGVVAAQLTAGERWRASVCMHAGRCSGWAVLNSQGWI